jgi:carbamoyltransferase
MDLSYFNYVAGLTMTSRKFHDAFGGPPRAPETPLSQKEMDLAASLQSVTETIVMRMAETARSVTGMSRICLAGGVALNSVANGKLIRSGLFEEVWVQPASGDAGGALGAALLADHRLFKAPRQPRRGDSMKGALLGEAFSGEAIKGVLEDRGAHYEALPEEADLLERTVAALDAGKVVGWFQGRMEFGPRALGNRSILGDPRNERMQSVLNVKIKFRESFRPFAPVVLAERAGEIFELEGESPYMLVVDKVKERWRLPVEATASPASGESAIRDLLGQKRSELPAITHVDHSARIQTVDAERNPLFYRLLKRWETRTGCPVLVNTSFNIRGEPIVRSPEDAWRCFIGTDMDVLVMGNVYIEKEANKALAQTTGDYREEYPLD